MLFITNREPQDSISFIKGQPYSFDLSKNSPANSVYYCERIASGEYREIGSEILMSKLKESSPKQLLFFIHGFSNLPEPDIFPRAIKLQEYFDRKEPGLIQVVPLIWPCDNDKGIIKDYWDDQKSADSSGVSFARLLMKFMKWRDDADETDPCLKRINILAHSMGNRVLRETLRAWDKYDLASGVPLLFRNTFLMAANVVNETLEKQESGCLISQSSRNVTVYYASDDLALRSSKISNLKNKIASRRLGHTGPEDMRKVQSNIYAIDCDNFNNNYDKPKGHSYFLDDEEGNIGEVFDHMFESIRSGRVYVGNSKTRQHIL